MNDVIQESEKELALTVEDRGCIDPFRVLSESERRRHLDTYWSHLESASYQTGFVRPWSSAARRSGPRSSASC